MGPVSAPLFLVALHWLERMGAKRFRRLCTAESDEEKRGSRLLLAVVCRARAAETGSRASLAARELLTCRAGGGTPRGCGTQRVPASAFRVLEIGRCCWATESPGSIAPRCVGVITCYVEGSALASFLELFNSGAV